MFRALATPFAVYLTLLVALGAIAVHRDGLVAALPLFAAGVLLWTLLEYLFHRFVLHLLPRGPFRRLLAGRHALHHRNPAGHPGIVPVWLSALNGALLLAALLPLVGTRVACGLIAGIIAGYLAYEYLHLRAHVGGVPRSRLGRALRAHHLAHHRRSARRNFAIVLPLWDALFATRLATPAPDALSGSRDAPCRPR